MLSRDFPRPVRRQSSMRYDWSFVKKISLNLGRDSYQVLISQGILRDAGRLIRKECGDDVSLCVVVTTARVRRLWGAKLTASLKKAKLAHAVLAIPDGERFKNLKTIESLLRSMVASGADRKSIVVAFGGGVVGDVAAFAASIYMRGIPCIQVPTTLLAQVDASIGGKTGVNLVEGKNLVGSFQQPRSVLIDPAVLSTLPSREYSSGFFEVIKCGMIADARLLKSIEQGSQRFEERDPKFLTSAIQAAVKVKADIVSKDERESGPRRVLNFGHTIGHALEAVGKYKRLLHGEAVAWGMIAALHIGVNVGVTPESVASRLTELVLRYGPLPRLSFSIPAVMTLIQSDKKTLHGVPRFVLIKEVGHTVISDSVSKRAIHQALSGILKLDAAIR